MVTRVTEKAVTRVTTMFFGYAGNAHFRKMKKTRGRGRGGQSRFVFVFFIFFGRFLFQTAVNVFFFIILSFSCNISSFFMHGFPVCASLSLSLIFLWLALVVPWAWPGWPWPKGHGAGSGPRPVITGPRDDIGRELYLIYRLGRVPGTRYHGLTSVCKSLMLTRYLAITHSSIAT